MKFVASLVALGSMIVAAEAEGGGRTATVVGNAAIGTGLVVTQFAVPVAVPQYAVPVAPTSYVQYGGAATSAVSSNSNLSTEALEDRIAAKVLQGLRASGEIKPFATPSIVGRVCGGCHGATDPKGGLSLAHLETLSCDDRLKCIARALADDDQSRMPPVASGIKLAPDELGKLLQELSRIGKAGE
ncbi:MAG TPA: c-type cytochrome domain-containing protein [Pirellulales bacterium]|nr:c-type cytochrome domain-containing protein [Pirellulales bacterium]